LAEGSWQKSIDVTFTIIANCKLQFANF